MKTRAEESGVFQRLNKTFGLNDLALQRHHLSTTTRVEERDGETKSAHLSFPTDMTCSHDVNPLCILLSHSNET